MDLYTMRQNLNMGISLPQMHLRVTDYCRVSTDHLEQKNSLKNQVEHFDEMIKKNPNWTYVTSYIDDGISGTTDVKRECFMQMIEDAKAGKFDLIITKEISRFSRNTLDSIKYTRILLDYGVAVLFVNDNINTALPDSELRLTIMASMAQDEIRRLSERVKFGMNQSIKNGKILGNNQLYGYKKDKLTDNLIIIDKEAEIVRKIFTMYAIDKISISKISKILEDSNIKTRKNKSWTISTLSRMLKNPKYKGYYCGKKSEVVDYMTKKVITIPENEWIVYEDSKKIPPIISKELWNQANTRLNSRKKTFGKQYSDKKMYLNRYPLSAKIYCANDNQLYHRRKQCKNEITWICSKCLKEGKKTCDSANIRESEIYYIFKDILKESSLDLKNIKKVLLELYESYSKKESSIEKYKKSKEKLASKKEKLLELNLEGALSNKEFKKQNEKYNLELLRLDKIIVSLENKKYLEKDKKITKIINEQLNSKDIIDKIILILLKKITVKKTKENTIKLNIYLNISDQFLRQLNIKKVNDNPFFQKTYQFKRGYNSKTTKKYINIYYVNCLKV